MKMSKLIAATISFVMVVSMLFTLTSCGLFGGGQGGSLELKSFVIDRSTIKTSYLVGEEVDFSGIKAYASYSDETLDKTYTFSELTLTYPDDLTATAGTKELVVSFMDPNLNVEQKASVQIIVTDPENVVTNALVAGFQAPANIVAFNSSNKDGVLNYGDTGFSGEFINGGFTYVVGDDNEFKLLPIIDIIGESGIPETLSMFYADVQLSLVNGDSKTALTAAADGITVTFSHEGTVIAVVDTLHNTYDFSDDAVGKTIEISVLPSAEKYEIDEDIHAVTLTVNVIDAYNIYEAWQLAVMDKDTSRDIWDTFKTEKGLSGLNVAGVVLHNDISLTANDVPESILYTTENDVTYTNSVTGETKTIPAGTKYLKDFTYIYNRETDEDFTINGNFFTLDMSSFPLVASPGVFGKDAPKNDKWYGDDFSNATLIRFESNPSAGKIDENSAKASIDNISLIGNAKRDNLVDSEGALASAGGLIFIKSTWYTDMTINNVIGNSFFITYFADYGGKLVANDVKCYDSYQNATMAWGDAYIEFNDSYLNGCGGPVAIIQSVYDENKHPTFITNNTVLETHLTGKEIWFTAVNAGGIIAPIKALSQSLSGAQIGSFVDSEGKMNVVGLLMKDGSDATAVIKNPYAQGSLNIDGNGIERWIQVDSTTGAALNVWSTVLSHPAYAQGAAFISVQDAEGNTHWLFSDGTNLLDLNNKPLGTDASHAAIMAAFQSAEYITLSQGGLSVVFEFYHAN